MPKRLDKILRKLTHLGLALLVFSLTPLPLLAQSSTPAFSPSGQADGAAEPLDAASAQLADRYLDLLAQAMLDEMTPADRVGQLFVVNFAGNDVSGSSDIATLIHEYRIGGVVLSPAYGNFNNVYNADLPVEIASLANRLQALAFDKALPEDLALGPFDEAGATLENLPTLAEFRGDDVLQSPHIPLWVGVEQLGGDNRGSALRSGFTPLPGQMALGATWDTALTRQMGEVVGRELAAVGVNLLLGPSLDVYTASPTDGVGFLGFYSYGGNSYWVSELGRAYIAGVHEGSRSQVATVARHFPGIGAADRRPEREVATIQRSAERMAQEALPPFLAVTLRNGEENANPAALTDVLMTSHMRYSAYQATDGTTLVEPFAFTPALDTLLEQTSLQSWQSRHGLLMTNALGLPAIRRAFAPDNSDIPFRRMALSAFAAGNDLIYLGRFSDDGSWESELRNIQEVIAFFDGRYAEDFDFARRVDDAARRIIRAKLAHRLSPYVLFKAAQDAGMTPEDAAIATPVEPAPTATPVPAPPLTLRVTPTLSDLLVGRDDLLIFDETSEHHTAANALVRQIARESVTLLYPDPQTVTDALPPPLTHDNRIVIFSDSRLARDCTRCPAEVTLGPDAIQDIMVRFYGPSAMDQIDADQIDSYTFVELAQLLDVAEQNSVDPDSLDAPAGALGQVTPAVAVTATLTATAGLNAGNASTITADSSTAVGQAGVPIAPSSVASAAALTATLGITPTVDESGFRLRLPSARNDADAATLTSVNQLEEAINEADWIILAMLDLDTATEPSSDAVKRFLRLRSEQIIDKRVIVLALHAPYFLDATEISQVSTYIAAYGHDDLFIENAVRALFRAFVPGGAPPVSVAGTRFSDLSERLQPDARVQLPLRVFVGGEVAVDTASSDVVNDAVFFSDRINVQVGPIMDYNGNLVPDGTEVEFELAYENAEGLLTAEPAPTRNGMAVREFFIGEGGRLLIQAFSGNADTGAPAAVTVAPFETLNGDVGLEAPGELTAAPDGLDATVSAADNAGATDSGMFERVNLVTLLLALFVITIMLSLLLIVQIRTLPRTTLVYNMLWAVIVGLTAYVLYGAGLLPGSQWLWETFDVWAAGIVVFVGMILPLLWLQLRLEAIYPPSQRNT